jgi:hypothetical protein
MRVSAFALVLAAVLLAGCGSSGHSAKPNRTASETGVRALAEARRAATTASSFHVSGHVASSGTPVSLDLTLVRGKGAKGSMSANGLGFDIVRIGRQVYIKGTDAFYKHFAGAQVAQLLHGKWLKSTSSGRLKQLVPLTDSRGLFAKISASHGKLVNDGKTTFDGQQVVAIRDTSDNSKLYIAATGKPYPVAIVGKKSGQSGQITFGGWNKQVSLSPPKNAIDISQLGSG